MAWDFSCYGMGILTTYFQYKMTARKTILLTGVAMLVLLFFLYLDFAKNTVEYEEYGSKTDAIVVLTGGRGRVDKGIEFFENDRAKYLIIAGVDKSVSLKSVFFNRDMKMDTGRIILEKESKSTYENAVEIKKIVEAMDIKSIILITSFYHMKRASYIFRRILPPQVDIHLYAVSTPNFDERAWWRGEGPVLLAPEFLKFYWYRFWI